MRNILASISILILLLFASCEKEEGLYKKPDVSAGTITKSVEMGDKYESQVFFDFRTGESRSNKFKDWDIAFSYSDENKIIINNAKSGEFSICNLGKKSFSDVIDVSKIEESEWQNDNPTGRIDSSAIGRIFQKKTGNFFTTDSNMYLIKLGDDKLFDKQYVKIRFLYRNGLIYQSEWTYLDQTRAMALPVQTDENQNFAYYCFECKSHPKMEPFEKDEWDIVFTSYKEYIYESSFGIWVYYPLRGVLSNPHLTKVANLTNIVNYDDIDLNYAETLVFNDDINNIGYNWKNYSIAASKYTINSKNAFVIKNRDGTFYKMKMVDYYNAKDDPGYPKFAYELLK